MSNACKGLRRNCLAQVAIVLRSPASMLVPYHLEPIPVSGAKTIVNVVTRRIEVDPVGRTDLHLGSVWC
jgi:hypothetical protein